MNIDKETDGAESRYSATELAALVGASTAALYTWRQQVDWPVSSQPPWGDADVEAVRAWRATGGGRRTAVAGGKREKKLREAQIRLATARAEKIELDRAILARDYVPIAELREGLARRIYAARTAFEGLARRLAPLVVGQEEVECERLIHASVLEVLEALASESRLPDRHCPTCTCQ